MGQFQTSFKSHFKEIVVNSVDRLPEPLYQSCLQKSKESLNTQYDLNQPKLYFETHAGSSILPDLELKCYRIKNGPSPRFDGELESYCKELIKQPYICIGRVVYLVQNYGE
jgi:hypothetical protein